MTTFSTLLLYGGVFVAGALGITVGWLLTSLPPETPASPDQPPRPEDVVDPIKSLGF